MTCSLPPTCPPPVENAPPILSVKSTFIFQDQSSMTTFILPGTLA